MTKKFFIKTRKISDFCLQFRGQLTNPFSLSIDEINKYIDALYAYRIEKLSIQTKKTLTLSNVIGLSSESKENLTWQVQSIQTEINNLDELLDYMSDFKSKLSKRVTLTKGLSKRMFQSMDDFDEIKLALLQGYNFENKENYNFFKSRQFSYTYEKV